MPTIGTIAELSKAIVELCCSGNEREGLLDLCGGDGVVNGTRQRKMMRTKNCVYFHWPGAPTTGATSLKEPQVPQRHDQNKASSILPAREMRCNEIKQMG
jgi:hypothetical protein